MKLTFTKELDASWFWQVRSCKLYRGTGTTKLRQSVNPLKKRSTTPPDTLRYYPAIVASIQRQFRPSRRIIFIIHRLWIIFKLPSSVSPAPTSVMELQSGSENPYPCLHLTQLAGHSAPVHRYSAVWRYGVCQNPAPCARTSADADGQKLFP